MYSSNLFKADVQNMNCFCFWMFSPIILWIFIAFFYVAISHVGNHNNHQQRTIPSTGVIISHWLLLKPQVLKFTAGVFLGQAPYNSFLRRLPSWINFNEVYSPQNFSTSEANLWSCYPEKRHLRGCEDPFWLSAPMTYLNKPGFSTPRLSCLPIF